jgi:hypothetical protein
VVARIEAEYCFVNFRIECSVTVTRYCNETRYAVCSQRCRLSGNCAVLKQDLSCVVLWVPILKTPGLSGSFYRSSSRTIFSFGSRFFSICGSIISSSRNRIITNSIAFAMFFSDGGNRATSKKCGESRPEWGRMEKYALHEECQSASGRP